MMPLSMLSYLHTLISEFRQQLHNYPHSAHVETETKGGGVWEPWLHSQESEDLGLESRQSDSQAQTLIYSAPPSHNE